MAILGVDYGRARLGLAVSDGLGLLAAPLPTLTVKHPRAAIPDLKSIVAQYNVNTVVVGLPLDQNGDEGDMAKEIRTWATTLQRATQADIAFIDERFTSKWADRVAADRISKKSRERLREKSDMIAAQAILQTYLDTRRATESST